MTQIILLLICNAASIVCLSSSVYLTINDNPNWGWFLFAGIVMAAIPDQISK